MKNKGNNKLPLNKKTTSNSKSNRSLWILGLVVVAVAIGTFVWRNKNNQNTKSSTLSAIVPKANQELLVGRWVRTDSEGNYIIEIKSAAVGGKLDAHYFNPNPIKVGRAEWQQKNGSLMIVVELRDVNYPGSTYTLNFIPSENRMTGNYYQAVEGTNFDVEFVRSR